MKAKSVLHLIGGDKIKTPEPINLLIANMDRLPQGGTLHVKRLTDHGKLTTCYIPAPTVVRLEEL